MGRKAPQVCVPSDVWTHGYEQHKHPLLCRRRHITHSVTASGPLWGRCWSPSALQTLGLLPFSYASGPPDAPGTSNAVNKDKASQQYEASKTVVDAFIDIHLCSKR